jgi:hypothetical protein
MRGASIAFVARCDGADVVFVETTGVFRSGKISTTGGRMPLQRMGG